MAAILSTSCAFTGADFEGPSALDNPAGVAGNIEPLSSEMLGGVAERAFWVYNDPDLAAESYTLAKLVNNGEACSGNFIGPHTFMTSTHCGHHSGSGSFIYVLTYDSSNNIRHEAFLCQTLFTTWEDMDLALWYCEGNGGPPPGLKYGYGDFDIVVNDSENGGFNHSQSDALVSMGRNVHRFWWNTIEDPMNGLSGDYNIYGTGTISALDNENWMVPSNTPWAPTCDMQNYQSIGVTTNVMSSPGASGSSHWSDNHRILLGPLTVAPDPERFFSAQLSLSGYIWNGWVLPSQSGECSPSYLNTALIEGGFNLNASTYYGWVDNELDGVFDIQKDTESVEGEYARDFYWLGFESNRRSVQWTRYVGDSALSINPSIGISYLFAAPSADTGTWVKVAGHNHLNLIAGTYALDYEVTTILDVPGPDIRICMGTNCFTSYAINSWRPQHAELVAASGDELIVWVKDFAQVALRNLSLQRKLSVFDFDTMDQRIAWDGRTDATTGLFWPDGSGSTSSFTDFAGVVTRDQSYALGNDWSLRSHHAGIKPWQLYRVCYSARDSVRDPQTGNGWVGVRVVEAGTGSEIVRNWAQVVQGSGWTTHCSGDFVSGSIGPTVEFGIWQSGSGSILVDNVQLQER